MNPISRMFRVWFVCVALVAVCLTIALSTISCSRSAGEGTSTVVLYTSVDDVLAQQVANAFEKETGIRVQILGDTEATKTTGLVTRIQSEMDHPVADVWWSSEPMGTIILDESGAFEPGAMRGMVAKNWPTALHSPTWSWIGMGMRARVIAYATDRVQSPPTTLAMLMDPKHRGRVGMARPQFGTTRIHMAMLADQWGIDGLTQWLSAMRDNKIRLYDGNARVVQAIAMGEIDIGLTDTDDVWAGQDNGWKVDLVYETINDDSTFPSTGPTLIPNTVAIIKNAPHMVLAEQLAEFLVSPTVEAMLYASSSHNTPIDPDLRVLHKDDVLSIEQLPDYVGATSRVREAIDACEQVLISP